MLSYLWLMASTYFYLYSCGWKTRSWKWPAVKSGSGWREILLLVASLIWCLSIWHWRQMVNPVSYAEVGRSTFECCWGWEKLELRESWGRMYLGRLPGWWNIWTDFWKLRELGCVRDQDFTPINGKMLRLAGFNSSVCSSQSWDKLWSAYWRKCWYENAHLF